MTTVAEANVGDSAAVAAEAEQKVGLLGLGLGMGLGLGLLGVCLLGEGCC